MNHYAQDAGSARALAAEIAAGRLTSLALVERCLDRIATAEGAVQAWKLLLADDARAEAMTRDAEAKSGHLRGRLHGVPVGIKDVIDVAGTPTRANCPARAELPPALGDATAVAHLRAAGLVVLGKTHTTELAYYDSVPPSRNPHDLTRTPGGSSSGSAAAVAAGMVPLALGTQTAGSVNRPAGYCGVGAFKPSTLAIGGAGVVPLAPSFDTVGAFAASAADAAVLAAAYAPAHLHLDAPQAGGSRIVVLRDGLIQGLVDGETEAAVAHLAHSLAATGLPVVTAAAPVSLEAVRQHHRVVLLAELARCHGRLPRDRVSPKLAADIAEGEAITAAAYHDALAALAGLRRTFWAGFGPTDVLLLPAAPTVAPVGTATGDPSFVIPTTALGGPVATVRAGRGNDSGMPVGALLLAAPGADARLAGFLLHEADPGLGL